MNVLILAGQRPGIDPLCAATGVERKALVPVAGRPMIDRVIDALDAAGLTGPYHVSGFDAAHDRRLAQAPSEAGPASSARAGLETVATPPTLVTTADHALLSPNMVRAFLAGATASGADFCVGLASREVIAAAYPRTKRTYLKFSDVHVSGCNLFYIADARGVEAIRFWERAQRDRKRPWRLAAHFGPRTIASYALGRLSLARAFDYASESLGLTAAPVMMPQAEAAIDVDKLADLELVDAILTART